MLVITVHDKVACTWSNPVVVQNADSAKRDFVSACSSQSSLIGQHPDDFRLYAIGDWHVSEDPSKDPQLVSYDKPKFLMQGAKNEQGN